MSVDDFVENKNDKGTKSTNGGNGNNGSKRNGIVRGAFYTLGAAAIGMVGYLIGKYRHLDGRSRYTTVSALAGLALVISLPKGCEIIDKQGERRLKRQEMEILSSYRKDSLNTVLELNRPRDTIAPYFNKLINDASNNNRVLEENYKNALSENSKKIESMISKSGADYTLMINELVKKNEKLQEAIDELKRVETSPYASNTSNNSDVMRNSDVARSDSRNSRQKKSSIGLERIVDRIENIVVGTGGTTQNYATAGSMMSEEFTPSYYMIDADRSDGEIQVYGICNDGSKRFLSITSKASFASNGGPADGTYTLRNKGTRSGELYPGFLAMDDPVGISGAGEYNQYLDQIQQGALANKSGIRVPNEIYTTLARLVDEKKTIINVHE
ncbi:MAG: hypothetical protein ACP5OA_03820 [Candidatus Woesearchaeota archaeon]